jgi:hypothetical protein
MRRQPVRSPSVVRFDVATNTAAFSIAKVPPKVVQMIFTKVGREWVGPPGLEPGASGL